MNESVLSLNLSNIAKSHLLNYELLRGYGTFPHPNVLAAYAVFVLVYAYSFRDILFHVKHNLKFLIPIVAFVVLLTQSKLFILFLLCMLLIISSKATQMFHVKHLFRILILILVTFSIYFVFHRDLLTTASTRVNQAEIQIQQYRSQLFGTGIGTYRLSYDTLQVNWWNMEPIHFVPYIVLSELGLGFSIFLIYCAYKYIKNVPRETWGIIQYFTVFLSFMLGVDHYTWDIYQGTFLLATTIWMILTLDNTINIMQSNVISQLIEKTG
ncbi:MAG: hypothetical protein WBO92_04120 [Candidatus Moraniibacteriota bacterium]